MNLFEMLDGYKTTPSNEIRKISNLLTKEVMYDGRTIWQILCVCFTHSDFASIEVDFNSFYNNFIANNPCYSHLKDDEIDVLQYRFLCELIYNLLYIGESLNEFNQDCKEIIQMQSIIKKGLELCGYVIDYKKEHYVTRKAEIYAEAIAVTHKDYKEFIFDYLISKTTDEKEHALLDICNKLEAIQSVDGYTKHVRDYIQLLRHPEERKNNTKYSWFYKKESYSENLDRLFKILLTYIAHLNSHDDLKYFDKNSDKSSGK